MPKLSPIMLAIAGITVTLHSHAASYTFTAIKPDPTNLVSSYARGINNAGEIVGNYVTAPDRRDVGYKYSGGDFTTISGPPGSQNFDLLAINDAGTILGYDYTTNSSFVINGSVTTSFQLPAGIAPPAGLTNSGQVLGNGPNGPYLYDPTNGSFTPLPQFGLGSVVNSINDSGAFVGTYQAPGGGRPYIYQNDQFTDLSNPLGFAVPQAINNNGDIVGSYSQFPVRGFFYSNGSLTSIEYSNSFPTNTRLYGINDAGQIIGNYENENDGSVTGFLADPATIPEPASIGLLLISLCALGAVKAYRVARQP